MKRSTQCKSMVPGNVANINAHEMGHYRSWLVALAAKIFRISILITGKEPTWREVFKLAQKS